MTDRPSLLRVRAALIAAAVALFAALGLLVDRALDTAEAQARLQQEFLAEQVFDEMETALTLWLAAEEVRSFAEWTPDDDAPDWLVGYVQVDPDGTPHVNAPAGDEALLALAGDLRGWSAPEPEPELVVVPAPRPKPRPRPRPAAVPEPDAAPQAAPDPAPEPEVVAQKGEPPEYVQLGQALNTGAMSRSGRGSRNVVIPQQQAANFDPSLMPGEARIEPDPVAEVPPVVPDPEPIEMVPAPEPVAPAPRPRPVPVQAPAPAADALIDVTVSPLQQVDAPSDRLVLQRTVGIDERRWVQAVVVDVPALQAFLAGRLDPAVAERVRLGWTDPPAHARVHAFAEPFEGLGAWLVVGDLSSGPSPWRWIAMLAALVVVVASAGLAAAWRTVTDSIRFGEQRSDFVSAVTHELKSPLTSIRMYSEMLEGGMVAPDKQREYHGTIRAEAERLSRLVDDVLAFSRIERGQTVTGERGTLGSAVAAVAERMAPQLAATGAALQIDVPLDLAPVEVDRDALIQVLGNLLDNAAKFSRDAADRRIHLRALRANDAVLLLVRDHGPGAPAAALPRLFEAFYRGERELVRTTKGTGIGLALVDALVRGMGGTVTGRNAPDGGFEVQITLPAPGSAD